MGLGSRLGLGSEGFVHILDQANTAMASTVQTDRRSYFYVVNIHVFVITEIHTHTTYVHNDQQLKAIK